MLGRTSILIGLALALALTAATLAQGPAQPQPEHFDPNWQASYWNNQTLSGSPALVRDDVQVGFNWGNGSPAPGLINADHFSARWTRNIEATPGKYRFTTTSDDGIRVWVDNVLIIDRWEVENFYRVAKRSLGWGDYQMRDLFAIERHVQLMMVAHAYPELERQQALMASTEPDTHVTLGDIQRQHQSLSRRAEIAQVFVLAQLGL